ncbi:MAG: hypothetical protein LC660_14820 [Desulfobacteraceae bacterium]|nr:hypothetical protein [Desulfobacteraceae bacterium]
MDAAIAREKADDIHDLTQRFVLALAGVGAHELKESLPYGAVLVTNRLMPSDTIFLSGRKASAVVLETGGKTSHAALFASEMGLPCVSGIQGVTDKLPSGKPSLVDTDEGIVIVNPDKKEKFFFREKRERFHQVQSSARAHSYEPAITRSGKAVSVLANVGQKEDVTEAIKNGADGIGLYRLENIYLGRQGLPDYNRLFKEIRKTLFAARQLPIFVRLLDIGADRENVAVETYFDDTHDAIFRLLEIAGRDAAQMPLSICGELAGREEALSKILNCGITTLSVVPASIPRIKEAVRQCD